MCLKKNAIHSRFIKYFSRSLLIYWQFLYGGMNLTVQKELQKVK